MILLLSGPTLVAQLGFSPKSFHQRQAAMDNALAYTDSNFDQFVDELKDFLRIP